MKVKVIKTAWYNNQFLQEGTTINFEGEKLPSWAVSLEPLNSEIKPSSPKVCDLDNEAKEKLLNEALSVGLSGNFEMYKVSTLKEKIKEAKDKKQAELLEKLNALKAESETLNINITDIPNTACSIEDEILIYKEVIEKKKAENTGV